MKAFIFSVLALFEGGAPSSVALELSDGRWKTMTTRQLAAKLLPRQLARSVVAHEASRPITEDAPPTQVVFYSRPYATPDGFCERRRYHVSIASDSPMVHGTDVRLGSCPTSPRAEFAHLQPQTNVAEAKAALRWLSQASAAARAPRPLDFDLDCVAETEPNLCADGARAALARLPVENTFIVGGSFNCRPGKTDFTARQTELPPGSNGSVVWDIQLVRSEGARPRLSMKWMIPPPF
jgi:hypothetical protein